MPGGRKLFNSLEGHRAAEPEMPFEPHAHTPPEEYDLYFDLPVFDKLSASGIRLEPFIPSIHGKTDYELFSGPDCRDVWRYLRYGPYDSYHDYLVRIEEMRRDRGNLLCAIFNTADDPAGDLVGVFAFERTSVEHLTTELGAARIHPKAQRTHVTSQVVALMLEQSFKWGFRRVQWHSNEKNEASQRTAKRMGFNHEAHLKWHRVLPFHKADLAPELVLPPDCPLGTPSAGVGRHSMLFSLNWRDWEDGQREVVKQLMEREPVRHRK